MPHRRLVAPTGVRVVLPLVAALAAAPAVADDCTPGWTPLLGPAPGVFGTVLAVATFDDGTGEALFVGGDFVTYGQDAVDDLARWDGGAWCRVGAGIAGGRVRVLLAGEGTLIVGGSFTAAGGRPAAGIASWDGTTWAPFGSGLPGEVRALAMFDDGSGRALYAAGDFTTPEGVTTLARWSGATWESLGSGVVGAAQALAVWDDGRGPALYVGGALTAAGGMPIAGIARWDGRTWSDVGGGTNEEVRALAVFDDGRGPALHAGGRFTSAGGVEVGGIARWDGALWSPLGSGVGPTGEVDALVVMPVGDRSVLCAGGTFLEAGGRPAGSVAQWDGRAWAALGDGADGAVRALHATDDAAGTGSQLLAGGGFDRLDGATASGVGQWNGREWSALGRGLDHIVRGLDVVVGSDGSELFVTGEFGTADRLEVDGVVSWNGARWTAPARGLFGTPVTAAAFDEGGAGRPSIFVGGLFWLLAEGRIVEDVARWDGSSWSAVGDGLDGPVLDLAIFDDGAGAALYAGGDFLSAGDVPVKRVARWDGHAWSPLGGGVTDRVNVFAVWDDGAGAALFAGGWFTTAGGEAVNFIGRWDGRAWSALGVGLNGTVRALAPYDDGRGESLFVGGRSRPRGACLRRGSRGGTAPPGTPWAPGSRRT